MEALPGVGPVLARSLRRYGIAYVGDLADLPPATLQRVAGGSTGRLLHQRAHGIDLRTVAPAGPPASIAATRRFEHDVLDPDQVRQALLALAGDLGAQLRTGAGDLRGGGGRGRRGGRRRAPGRALGTCQVDDPHGAVLDDDVAGREVAVGPARGVEVGQRFGRPDGGRQDRPAGSVVRCQASCAWSAARWVSGGRR
ncbi:hypothetical protein [Streptomyces sp. CB03911]|uniref:DNA polymerase thumb domain-containing protein n=1 Tax=Streptomyces sp. CB03911 TaxID=1804758 RepID=UPI0018FEDD52|nr:hypothetical protein [Streptomyces sp. CB03911]